MPLQSWLKGLVLAGPVVLFPFSRSYYIFYVLILIVGMSQVGLPVLWREYRGLRYATLAVILPLLLTIVAWALFFGGAKILWLEKLGVAVLAGLLGLATAGVAQDARIKSMAQGVVGVAILTWLLDGLLQLLIGADISGRNLGAADTPRFTAYFFDKTKLGYYVGMMALLPAFWLLAQRRVLLACATLLVAAGVVMGAASRYGMLTYLIGCAAFVLVQARALKPVLRWSLLLGAPALMVLLAVFFYYASTGFHIRVNDTAQVLDGLNYPALNVALSYRLDIWFPAVALGMDHWLFGVGPGQLTEAIRPYLADDNIFRMTDTKIFHAHQVLLEIWLATGIVGLLAFMAFYGWLSRGVIKSAASSPNMGWACLLVFLVTWFPLGTQHGFYSSEVMLLSFYTLGLGFGWVRAGGSPIST